MARWRVSVRSSVMPFTSNERREGSSLGEVTIGFSATTVTRDSDRKLSDRNFLERLIESVTGFLHTNRTDVRAIRGYRFRP